MKLSKQEKARKRERRWSRMQFKNFRGRHDYIDKLLKAREHGCRPLPYPILIGPGVAIGLYMGKS